MTRGIYNPARPWLNDKVANWVRFLGVDPDQWKVSQAGGTGWISKRPFSDLQAGWKSTCRGRRVFDEVAAWLKPLLAQIKETFDANDLVWVQGVEGPLSDTYIYTDMELLMTAVSDAPELIRHILDCMAELSVCVARVYAERSTSPLFFMGEDICHRTGPIISPAWLRANVLPQWRRIHAADPCQGIEVHLPHRRTLRAGPAADLGGTRRRWPASHRAQRLQRYLRYPRQYPQKFLFGNVCCSVTLPRGNAFDVERRDSRTHRTARARRARYFIGSSSEVHNLVPLENAETMYRTVHDYGTYPLDIDGIQRRRREIEGKQGSG